MISKRALITALCVFFAIALAVFPYRRLDPSTAAVSAADARLLTDMNYCLHYGEVTLPSQYTEKYRPAYDEAPGGSGLMLILSLNLDVTEHMGIKTEHPPCIGALESLAGEPGTLNHDAAAYAQAFNNLRPITQGITHGTRRTGNDPLRAQILDKALQAGMAELRQRAEPFHRALEAPHLQWRLSQLQQLDESRGQDQYWHMLHFMVAAREAIDQLDAHAGDASLRANQVAGWHASLLQAWTDADAFFRAHPTQRMANDTAPTWTVVKAPAKAWLDSLATLQQHWMAKAEPAQLSDDWAAVDRRYDQLLARYNATVFFGY